MPTQAELDSWSKQQDVARAAQSRALPAVLDEKLELKARVLQLEAATKSGQMTVGFALARLALDFCSGALVPDAGVLKQHAEERNTLLGKVLKLTQELEQAKAARGVLVQDLAETQAAEVGLRARVAELESQSAVPEDDANERLPR